ncbi:MAG: AmmeMemoRadiSam system radical SAM enzyme [Chloroflexi bacterium]|nr:AmmeMemoRadiSam system radical SAM enzyme [Chloroflexota bacterium]
MREAMIYEKLTFPMVRCHTCQWRCRISQDRFGVCGMYQNQNGALYNLNYARASSVAVDPIEKKPLYHFYPGSQVFSLGGMGCNFHCKHCQNWEISSPDADSLKTGCHELQPDAAVDMAVGYRCQGVAWTYNEPTIWFEYTHDGARLAGEKGLYTVYVTNGYATPQSLDAIGPHLGAWRVDIKGFSDTFYRDLARVPHWREILDITRRAKEKWNMHVEVVTNVIPTMNDDDAQLSGIAGWIASALGDLTPWHVTRFYPLHQMAHLNPTPVATLEHAWEIGRQAGLKFVYVGNVPGHHSENTVCYACGNIVVERHGYRVRVLGLNGSKCKHCGAELNFRVAPPEPGA